MKHPFDSDIRLKRLHIVTFAPYLRLNNGQNRTPIQPLLAKGRDNTLNNKPYVLPRAVAFEDEGFRFILP